MTRLKENFYILAKDKDEALSDKQRVDIFMKGIKSSDVNVIAAKTDVYKDYQSDFDAATTFLSGLISHIHAGAQIDYANRNSGKRRYVSAMGSQDGGRGGRGRARRGGDRYSQQSGRGGRGREGRGCGNYKSYIDIVDVTDPHRNFSAEEWDKLGTVRSVVLQMRMNSGRGNRDNGRGGGRNQGSSDGQRNASSATRANSNAATDNTNPQENDSSTVVSEITERGSQNGRGFSRGAYT